MENTFYYNRSLRPPSHDSISAARESSLRRFDLEKRRILRTLELVKDAKNKLMVERLSLVNQLMKVKKLHPGRQVEITISNENDVTDPHNQHHLMVTGNGQAVCETAANNSTELLVPGDCPTPFAAVGNNGAAQLTTQNRPILHKVKAKKKVRHLVEPEDASLCAASEDESQQLSPQNCLMEQEVDPADVCSGERIHTASILERMVDGDFFIEDPQEDVDIS